MKDTDINSSKKSNAESYNYDINADANDGWGMIANDCGFDCDDMDDSDMDGLLEWLGH